MLCPTHHAGWLVAGALAPLAAVADEIVIAADSRVGQADLDAYASVATRVVRFEHIGSNRHWSWLSEQARGDWVLIVDGDETPSAAFLDALPDLITARSVNQFSLPIHWVWGDPAVRLVGEPWQSDRRLRLMRNGPLLRFMSRQHELAHPAPPIAYRDDLPFLHLDLLTRSEAERKAKAAGYDADRFGYLTPDGRPFNQALYFPDVASPPVTEPLAPADAEHVGRVMSRIAPLTPAKATVDADLVTRETLQARAFERGPAAPFGSISVTELPNFIAQRADNVAWVRVTNDSARRWAGQSSPAPRVELVASWGDAAAGALTPRTLLPHDLESGESALLPFIIAAPDTPGPANLSVALAVESGAPGPALWSGEVEVLPGRNELFAAAIAAHDGRLPRAEIRDIRRAIARIDGLLAPPGTTAAPPLPAHAELVTGLPVGEWALDGPTLDYLAGTVGSLTGANVAEFGTGTSTVLLASLLGEQGGHLVSFEHDPDWLEITRLRLQERGLDAHVTLIELPVTERTSTEPPGVTLTDQARAALDAYPPSLVLVDGPTLSSGASRLSTVPELLPWLRGDVHVLLDDAFRDAELTIVERWHERLPIADGAFLVTNKGLWHGVVRTA